MKLQALSLGDTEPRALICQVITAQATLEIGTIVVPLSFFVGKSVVFCNLLAGGRIVNKYAGLARFFVSQRNELNSFSRVLA